MPAVTYTTFSVSEYWPNEHMPCWYVEHEKPDGTVHIHVMPKMTLAARSIEYAIDPEDTQTLWDIAIHEPFMVHPYDIVSVQRNDGDPAAKLGLTVPSPRGMGSLRAGDPMGVTCHTAPTLDLARAAHEARLTHCKAELVLVDTPAPVHQAVLDHREPAGMLERLTEDFERVRTEERTIIEDAERGIFVPILHPRKRESDVARLETPIVPDRRRQ